MPKITARQLRYAEDRLAEIRKAERAAIQAQCHITPDERPVTFDEFAAKVLRGSIKARRKTPGGLPMTKLNVGRHTLLSDVFDYTVPVKSYDHDKELRLMAASDAKWKKIWDKLFLSDAAEVLAMIEDLEKKS